MYCTIIYIYTSKVLYDNIYIYTSKGSSDNSHPGLGWWWRAKKSDQINYISDPKAIIDYY